MPTSLACLVPIFRQATVVKSDLERLISESRQLACVLFAAGDAEYDDGNGPEVFPCAEMRTAFEARWAGGCRKGKRWRDREREHLAKCAHALMRRGAEALTPVSCTHVASGHSLLAEIPREARTVRPRLYLRRGRWALHRAAQLSTVRCVC